MAETYTTERLLALRKLTRSIADLLRGQMQNYLSALAPLMRPAALLGHYVQGGAKEVSKDAIKTFQDLESIYGAAAASKPFGLLKELRTPFEVAGSALELSPVEYSHTARTDGQAKTVTITSPFKWVLSYADFAPGKLRQLLADKNRTDAEAGRFVLHYCLLQVILAKQTAASQMLDALHFDLTAGRLAEFGELPIITVASTVPTLRPPDSVIMQSTEISGRDAFEEIVDVEGLLAMRDPFKEKLLEFVKSQGLG
ncbi:MAG TPA: hypothetical protein VL523_06985 [Terriglobia bacterium]|nr:hypothetical protein [Terriglobia bacterium]